MSQFRANSYSGQSTSARFAKYAGEQFENPTDIILQKLEAHGCQPHLTGTDQWESLCPVHQCDGLHSKDEKLQISIGMDDRCLLHCFAHGKHKDNTCNDETITAALGLRDYHLFRPQHADRNGRSNGHANGHTNGKPKPDRTHVYQDQHGDAVYKSLRRNGNWFQERYDVAKGTFVGGGGCMKGVPLFPYMLPELLRRLQERPEAIVHIAEGERDVEALWDLGWAATCNVGGADKWRDEYTEWFKGRKVVLFQDNDEAGRRHAQKVARSVHAAGCQVRVLGVPEPHKDVSDFIAAGGLKAKLFELIVATPDWTPAVEPETKESKSTPEGTFGMVEKLLGEMVPLWQDWIMVGDITMLCGKRKRGKSRFYLSLVKSLWFGDPWPDGAENPWNPGTKTVILAYDRNHREISRDMRDFGIPDEAAFNVHHPEDEMQVSTPYLHEPKTIDYLDDIFTRHPEAKLLVVDPLTSASCKNLCSPEEITALLNPVLDVVARHNVACLMLVHENAEGGAYGKRIEERARILLKMDRYEEEDRQKLRVWVDDSHHKETPAITMWHEDQGNRFGPDSGPIIRKKDKGRDQAAPEPRAGERAALWVTARFREKRVWTSDELKVLAIPAGISTNALFKSEQVKNLPIKKRPTPQPDGTDRWDWTANPGWPPDDVANEQNDSMPF